MAKTVAHVSAVVAAMQDDLALVSVLLSGTRGMRAAGQKYLPTWPAEDSAGYQARLNVATLFPAYKRTVAILTGKPFGKPLTINSDVPPVIKDYIENDIDRQGNPLHVFGAEAFEQVIGRGIAGILVDYPQAGGTIASNANGVPTKADEEAARVRPYFVLIRAEQILGGFTSVQNGEEQLTMLRLMETVEEQDGPWDAKSVKQVRVLEVGKWTTYRQPNPEREPEVWTLFDEGLTTLDEIPFVALHGDRTGFLTSQPPLIELAHLNVEHWQSASDQQTILHVARVPILVITGVDDDKAQVTVGAGAAIKLPMGATMHFVEHTGQAIAAGAADLDKLEERMRQAGAEMLVVKPQRITAFQSGVENELAMCELQRIVQDFNHGLNRCLDFMADWLKMQSGGTVSMFDDFAASTLAEASAQFLVQAATAGKISDETLFVELQRRGIVGAQTSWLDEKDRLDAQGPPLGKSGETAPPLPGTGVSSKPVLQ